MVKKITLLAIFNFIFIVVLGQTVIVSPSQKSIRLDSIAGTLTVSNFETGKLSQKLSVIHDLGYKKLKIEGHLNGSDFRSLNDFVEKSDFITLDLSKSVIVTGGEPYRGKGKNENYTKNNTITKGLFDKMKKLSYIILPETIVAIEGWSFNNLRICELNIPDKCLSIDLHAIYDCKLLKTINFGNSIKEIHSCFVDGSSFLMNINVSETNNFYKSIDGILYSKNGDTLIKYPEGKTSQYFSVDSKVKSIGKNAFSYTKFKSINLPDGLNDIGQSAFYYSQVVSIDLPKSLITIGNNAFCNCDNLTEITIPDQIKKIESSCFSYCNLLQKVHIGANVNTIAGNAFDNSMSIKEFSISEYNESFAVKQNILYTKDFSILVRCPSMVDKDSLQIDQKTKIISEHAFQNCKINKIRLSDNLKQILDYAFSSCSVKELIIPSVQFVGQNAFSYCKNIHSLTLPNNLITISSYALSDCSNLHSIYLPSSLRETGGQIFDHCINLNNIYSRMTDVICLKKSDFEDIAKDCTWHVPVGLSNKYKSQSWWMDSWNIVEDYSNNL